MNVDEFSQFLIKLDRNKASIPPKNRNSTVWEVESTQSTAHSLDSVTIHIYEVGSVKWDGIYLWDGKAQWGDG